MLKAPQGACVQCVTRYWHLFFVVSVIQMEYNFERQHHLLGFSEEPSLPNRIVLGSLRLHSRGLTKEWVILPRGSILGLKQLFHPAITSQILLFVFPFLACCRVDALWLFSY